jgi:perosamine synthetase
MRIPICKPFIDENEQIEVAAVLQSGWLMQGPKVEQFEQAFRQQVDSGFAIAVSSCSTALHLATRLCGIQPGDEVIVPSFTWIATAAAVEECGAHPVFCDVDLQTFNIDVDMAESLIGPRTRAIIAVNLFGLPADLPRLSQIACKQGIFLIEDAACSLGGTIAGRHSGTFGRVGCFSFHPRKSITTGEGGMIVGNCEEDAALLRSLRSHGGRRLIPNVATRPYDLGDFDQLGYNYRLTDLQAAVGLAQMKKLGYIMMKRRELAAAYSRELAGIAGIALPHQPAGYEHAYQSYVVMVDSSADNADADARAHARRNRIMEQLHSAGIATRPGTHAVHLLTYYRQKYGLSNSACPQARRAMNQSIALPLYPTMTDSEQAYVIDQFKSAVTLLPTETKIAVSMS